MPGWYIVVPVEKCFINYPKEMELYEKLFVVGYVVLLFVF